MSVGPQKLSATFKNFFDSEKSSGIVLIACTIVSLVITNFLPGAHYPGVWHVDLGGLTIEQWINDGLMAIFFLLIGLELRRELASGELANRKNALLPIFAAGGGIVFPALIHFIFNYKTATQAGLGIPMATDIAFALGALALLGKRVPASLKIFLTALAVVDDLGAIIVIAVFYTARLSLFYLGGAILTFVLLSAMNRFFRVMSLLPYLAGGALLWFLMLESGVHATVAGVLLAFTIPFSAAEDDEKSASYRLENFLHKPVAFIILPVFALANTGIVVGAGWFQNLFSANSEGIWLGLIFGKPLGIAIVSLIVVGLGLCRLPPDLTWKHIFGAGLLGGIGFTMSIFITNLAFGGRAEIVNASKIAILLASLTAGTAGFLWLKLFGGEKN